MRGVEIHTRTPRAGRFLTLHGVVFDILVSALPGALCPRSQPAKKLPIFGIF
jgi:hypothetical protein